MRRFIRNTTIYFIIPVAVLGIFLELLLRNIPNHYAYKRDYLDKNSHSIEVLILGASHSYFGINPAYLKLNSFNAANPAQTLNIDFEILKKYNQSLTNLKWIIQPIAYPSLVLRLENSVESWRVCNYIIYFDLNIPHKITDYTLILSNNLQFNLDRIISYYLLKDNDMGCSKLGWGTDYNLKPQEDLVETGKLQAMKETFKNISINDNLMLLKSMINYAKEKNVKVLLFTPPAYYTYIEYLDSAQLNQTIRAVNELANKDTNVVYVNLLNDKSFTKTDFHDAYHLNQIGAQKLSLKIDSIMASFKK